MKYLSLIGALFLSASPALADDFLYVVCDMKGTNKTMSRPSGQVISETPLDDSLKFQVNLKELKMRNHKNSKWVDISVRVDQIIQNTQINEDGYIGQVQGVMPLNPPGPTSTKIWMKTQAEYWVTEGEGECREIDSSIFDEASK